MSKAQKQALSALLIAFFAALMAVGAVRYLAPLTNLENKVADIRVAAMQRPMPASEDVVVVAINEETLSARLDHAAFGQGREGDRCRHHCRSANRSGKRRTA